MPFTLLQSLDANGQNVTPVHVRTSDVKLIRESRPTQIGKTCVEFFHTKNLIAVRESADEIAKLLGLLPVKRWSPTSAGDGETLHINVSQVVRVHPQREGGTAIITFTDGSSMPIYGLPEFVSE